jgi:tetratricopeptide (TPR) repeat protein
LSPVPLRRRQEWLIGLLIVLALAAFVLGRSLVAEWPNALARRALADHHYAEARSRLRWSLRIDGENPQAHFLLARALRKQGDFRDAEEALRRAEELDPHDERFAMERVFLAAHQADPTTPLRDALAAAGEDLAETCEAYAAGMLLRDELQPAHRLIAAWQEQLPDDPQSHYYRGLLLARQRWPEEAESQFRKALELAPSHPFAATSLADLLLEKHQLEEALLLYARAANAGDTRAAGLVGQAKCWRMLDHPEEARGLLETCLSEDADSAAALCELGRLEVATGDYSAATAHLQAAHRLDPDSREVKQHLAAALSAVGRREEAREIFETLEPQSPKQ